MERQVWNRWIAVEDASDLLTAERERAGVQDDWPIGFLYVDHEAGLSLRLDSWARKSWLGRLQQTNIVPRDEMVIVRFGVLQKSKFHILSDRDRARFSLPVKPDWLHVYSRDDLEQLRSDVGLDPLRAPGFPDDLKVGIVDTPSGNVEFVWARAEKSRSGDVIECVLLNKPKQRSGVGAGDRILVEVFSFGEITTAVCRGKSPPDSRTASGFLGSHH